MADIPSIHPTQITAGDSVSWRRSLPEYPASAGWALAYTLVSAGAVQNITAEADGDDYTIDLTASTTADWAADTYQLVETVTLADQRVTLARTALLVLPDLAAATGGIDTRCLAQKILDSINAWLESRAPVAGAMELNGRKISWYPLPDLLKLRDRYRAEVAYEQRTAAGRGARILAVL